jgi:hypothetical protein
MGNTPTAAARKRMTRGATPAKAEHLAPYLAEPIPAKGRWRTLYDKRKEENRIHFGLTDKAAEDEARLHVAHVKYLEASRKAEKAKQIALFDLPTVKGKKAMVLE